jgi:hypothetical protein
MKTAAVICASVLLAACVPATEDLNPRGAAGFDLVPSATSLGEPFTTADGYTLSVERAVLVMQASAKLPAANGSYFGASEEINWDTRTQALLFVRALPIGPIDLEGELASISSYDFLGENDRSFGRDLSNFTKTDLDRIRSWIADLNESRSNTSSGRIVVHAQKNGRSWTLDVVLPGWFGTGPKADFTIRQDALERRTVTVMPENLFRRATMDRTLRFQAFADADLNGDGTINEAELNEAQTPDSEQGVMRGTIIPKMYEALRERMTTLVVLAP